ncbi:TIGR03668 family PPOX class F420-dependent oxidoreductase [Mycobacterium sp. SMC-4]|uniref:TIGR03668 family PPOX class F420-dependent oxidoreductase n=1 Tax=Mycobacterium sp. SMC-4 TaxID=2857059 RepID=UPI003D0496C6
MVLRESEGGSEAARFGDEPVAMLATVRPDGTPHVVPVVFALTDGENPVVYTAVDGKPKSGRRLQRLANIDHHPAVSLLVSQYDDDWSRLWWVRADGIAQIHDGDAEAETGLTALRAKYPQYRSVGLEGPVIAVQVTRWASWQGG